MKKMGLKQVCWMHLSRYHYCQHSSICVSILTTQSHTLNGFILHHKTHGVHFPWRH